MTSPERILSIPSSPQSPTSSADVFSAEDVADTASDSSEDDQNVEYDRNNDNVEEYEGGGGGEEDQLHGRTEHHDQNPNLRVLNELSEVMPEMREDMSNTDTLARIVGNGFPAVNVINVLDDVEERLALTATQGDFQELRGNRAQCERMDTQAGIDADSSLHCPICMESWTNFGNHRISCLPCGHLFGLSCITKWIQQGGKRIGKCPHCNKKCKVSEIRVLYVPRIAVADGEMQQELILLQADNEKLKWENKNLIEENHRMKEEQEHHKDIKYLRVAVGVLS